VCAADAAPDDDLAKMAWARSLKPRTAVLAAACIMSGIKYIAKVGEINAHAVMTCVRALSRFAVPVANCRFPAGDIQMLMQ